MSVLSAFQNSYSCTAYRHHFRSQDLHVHVWKQWWWRWWL